MTDVSHLRAIEFRSVTYQLPDGRTLLPNLNLEAYQGETLILLGRSGCGKTTTLKLINCLLEPSEGAVMVEGTATTERYWCGNRLRGRGGD